jgi:hypothetical protein
VGTGRVINIADNPNFRAFWLGGAKLFMNAIFFGRIIDAASARTEEPPVPLKGRLSSIILYFIGLPYSCGSKNRRDVV